MKCEDRGSRDEGCPKDPWVITRQFPVRARLSLAFTTDRKCDAERSPNQTTAPGAVTASSPFSSTGNSARFSDAGPFTSLISPDCGTPYFSRRA